MKIDKIGFIEVDPALYIEKFGSSGVNSNFGIYAGMEEGFCEDVRLSAFETGVLDDWPTSLTALIFGNAKNESERDFQQCVRGLQEPKTIHEQIVVKLVYQALSIGGLFYIQNISIDSFEGDLKHLKSVENDIDQMPYGGLREFLIFLRDEIYSVADKKLKRFESFYDRDDFDDPNEYEKNHDPRWSEDENLLDLTDAEVGLADRLES